MSRSPGPLRLAPLVLAALVCAAQGALAQSPAVAPTPAQVSPDVDKAYAQLMAAPAIQKLLDAVRADHERSVEDLRMLTEIEAPPFKEQKRAEAFLARMKAFGLTHAKIDAEGNVIGLRKGTGNGPKLLISAHLDTVFPAGTDVKVKERDGRLHAPGIADDTRGLAVLLSWLKVLNDNKVQTVGDLLFVGNVGEEELGNLRGIKAVFRDNLDIDGMVGLEPAPDGTVLMLGTGSHRYEVSFKGPGGHSYGAFGQVPSAIHGMGRAIAKIAEIRTPSFPKTTFTVGTVAGGEGRLRFRRRVQLVDARDRAAHRVDRARQPEGVEAVPAGALEVDLVAMAARAHRYDVVAVARLQAEHAVDLRVVAEQRLHAAQVAQALLADAADEQQVADGGELVVLQRLQPRQQHREAARVVGDAGCVPLAVLLLDLDVGAGREHGVQVRGDQQGRAVAAALADADHVAFAVY